MMFTHGSQRLFSTLFRSSLWMKIPFTPNLDHKPTKDSSTFHDTSVYVYFAWKEADLHACNSRKDHSYIWNKQHIGGRNYLTNFIRMDTMLHHTLYPPPISLNSPWLGPHADNITIPFFFLDSFLSQRGSLHRKMVGSKGMNLDT